MPEPSNEAIMTEIKGVREDTADIKHRLFGNGQPGLIRTVETHNNWIKSRVWIERVFVAAIIAGGVPVVGGLVYWVLIARANGG